MTIELRTAALACRDAAVAMAGLSAIRKRDLLIAMAVHIEAHVPLILAANELDMAQAAYRGIGMAMLDRLRLDAERIAAMTRSLREVADLPDPVGHVTRRETRPNGVVVERVRVPLGVIAMIYEARPNVTVDAAALCLKAGNGVILRGGSEAIHSNRALAGLLRQSLFDAGVPSAAMILIEDLRRETMIELLQLTDIVDLAIPRGGEGLIRFVAEHARVPVIKHYKGVCHLYVDKAADLTLALNVLIDGKVSRPSACNALETLLVHRHVAETFFPRAARAMENHKVEMRGCERTRAWIPAATPVSDEDYAAEFLDLIIAIRVVDDLEAAIAHIRKYTSDHTEVIATADSVAAQTFVSALRSAVVMVNASSRFSDGGELGLGAEIGISTTRLHAYGPMGIEALTIERYVLRGDGQVRHGLSEANSAD